MFCLHSVRSAAPNLARCTALFYLNKLYSAFAVTQTATKFCLVGNLTNCLFAVACAAIAAAAVAAAAVAVCVSVCICFTL